MISDKETRVLDVLKDLGIDYTKVEHPPVFTVEEAEKHWRDIEGAHCKNLFLRNKKGNRHYLVVVESTKRVDLKALNQKLGEDRLSFGSDERLMRKLGLQPGAVSPFGLINNADKDVMVVIDRDLEEAGRVNFHPNVNTATVGLDTEDFKKFLEWCGNRVRIMEF